MPGPLKNGRHEIVAQERARGATQFEAATAAGLCTTSANRVCRHPAVLDRIQELNPDGVKLVKVGPQRRTQPRRLVYTTGDIISDCMALAQDCRAAGEFREANLALKRAGELIAARDARKPKPKPTKKQREQRQRDEPDPEGELNDDPPANNGGTPDISEIADMVGRLNDGPGDLTEAEATRAVAGGPAGSVHEADGNG
jgi:hypothetical protein